MRNKHLKLLNNKSIVEWLTHCLLAVLITFVLSACGGGGGSSSVSLEDNAVVPLVVMPAESLEFVVQDINGATLTLTISQADIQPLTLTVGDVNSIAQDALFFLFNLNRQAITVDDVSYQVMTTIINSVTTSMTTIITVDKIYTDAALYTVGTDIITLANYMIEHNLPIIEKAFITVTTTLNVDDSMEFVNLIEANTIDYDETVTNTITMVLTSTVQGVFTVTAATDYVPDDKQISITIASIIIGSYGQTITNVVTSSIDIITNLSDILTITAANQLPDGTVAIIQELTLTIGQYDSTITVTNKMSITYVGADNVEFTPSQQIKYYYFYHQGDKILLTRDDLVAMGITLSPITVSVFNNNATITLGVITLNIVDYLSTVTTTIDENFYDDTVIIYDSYLTVTQDITDLSTVTLMISEEKDNGINITLYAGYTTLDYKMTVNLSGAKVITTFTQGITLGFDSDGSLSYGILPAPNPKGTIEYDTAEYKSINVNNGLGAINAKEAYERGYFGASVTIAVVDTGVLTSHVELAANIVPGYRLVNAFGSLATTNITDLDGHGTHVAGIAGGVLDGQRFHGVAPSVSIMPIQSQINSDGGFYPTRGLELLLTSSLAKDHVQIVNNSWGFDITPLDGTYNGTRYRVDIPFIHHILDQDIFEVNEFEQWGNDIADNDMVLVFAAGNDYWNSETGEIRLCDPSLDDDEYCGAEDSDVLLTVSAQNLIDNFVADSTNNNIQSYGTLSTLNISPNDGGGYSLMPLYNSNFIGKLVIAVALNSSNSAIASFSNGCGPAKNWCLAAPGTYIESAGINNNTDLLTISGTSMATPHISGALAVLKSRFPSMPMSVVLAILFEAADDMGDTGIDEVYGHGKLNLGSAITLQGSVNLVIPGVDANNNSQVNNSFVVASPQLHGFARQLSALPVAVEYLEGQYYNMSMSDLITETGTTDLPEIGSSAYHSLPSQEGIKNKAVFSNIYLQQDQTGKLINVHYKTEQLYLRYNFCDDCDEVGLLWDSFDTVDINNTTPYFMEESQHLMGAARLSESWAVLFGMGLSAKDKTDSNYSQWGVRWLKDNIAGGNLYGEYMHISENETLLGDDFSNWGINNATTHQGRFGFSMPLHSSWLLNTDYTIGFGKADINNHLLNAFNYRYQGVRLGLKATSLLRSDDVFRFGIHRKTSIDKGTANVSRGVLVDGKIDYITEKVSWSNDNITSLHLGYGVRLNKNTELGLGLEHARIESQQAQNETAASLYWRLRF